MRLHNTIFKFVSVIYNNTCVKFVSLPDYKRSLFFVFFYFKRRRTPSCHIQGRLCVIFWMVNGRCCHLDAVDIDCCRRQKSEVINRERQTHTQEAACQRKYRLISSAVAAEACNRFIIVHLPFGSRWQAELRISELSVLRRHLALGPHRSRDEE